MYVFYIINILFIEYGTFFLCRKCRIGTLLQMGDECLESNDIATRDHEFREWLPFHVYWFFLQEGVLELKATIEALSEAFVQAHEQVTKDKFPTLDQYMQDCRKEHFRKAFIEWRPLMKPTAAANEQPYLACTSRRVFYR